MKTISRVTLVMRVTGTVLLCLALVLSCYALILSGSAYDSVNAKLAEVASPLGALDRVGVANRYYAAVSRASSERQAGNTGVAARVELTVHQFDPYAARYDAAVAARRKGEAEETLAHFEGEFDASAFLSRYALREDTAEQRAIDELYAYLDSLTAAVVLPKGKALPSLGKGQSQAFFPGFYDSLVAEKGEEAVGTYLEFLETCRRVIDAYAAENKLDSAKGYMETAFQWDAYAEALAALRGEEAAEAQSGFLARFAAACEALPDGKFTRDALNALIDAEYAHFSALRPEIDRENLVLAIRACVDAGQTFDGSDEALLETLDSLVRAGGQGGFAAFQRNFVRTLVDEADKRAGIGAVTLLWTLAALRLWVWGAGLALVVLAAVLRKALIARYMKKQTIERVKDESDVLLRVDHLKQYFRSGDFVNKAVDDVSFFIKKGEVFGLVGESGCGKTTTGRTIINLYDPTEGDVYFQGLRVSSTMNGVKTLLHQEKKELEAKKKARLSQRDAAAKADVAAMNRAFSERQERVKRHAYESEEDKRRSVQRYRDKRKAELTEAYQKDAQKLAGQALADRKRRFDTELSLAARDNIMTRMQMIFQDPIASINPRMTVREIIAEGLIIRGVKDQKYIDDKVYEMLELVGLVPEHADRYPHEFSGGQRQRIGIARAIALEPDLIIADEPISALDVSIQAQVINLLNELRNKMGLTILFIAHNLSVVKYFSDRIAVMYFGRIVEMTTSDELFRHPLHPYTKSLLSAIPYPDPHYEKRRKRVEYDPDTQHDYSVDKPSMREITPGHFIHCNDAEFARYREELGL